MGAPDRREQLRTEIARRLRPVCPQMTTDEFLVMVDDVVRIQLKFEGRVTPTPYELEMHRRHDAVERAIRRY